jgi:uncharacterized SAM-binding protein YcdF (DUF218 family)
MGFALSKILWGLVAPGSLLFLLLCGAFLWHRRRPALSRGLLGLVLLAFAVVALLPVTQWLASPLEQRFPLPQPQSLARVDGIIVLGGAIESDPTGNVEQPALDDAAERLTSFAALARRYPGARLIYSGGSGQVRNTETREADLAKPLLQALGVDSSRTIYERESRNTWENAVYSQKLADPKPGETWLLVTSAWHMPRAVGCFRKLGWNVTPYPVDYVGNGPAWASLDAIKQFHIIGLVEKEWIGLITYRLMGRSDVLFPAPQDAH